MVVTRYWWLVAAVVAMVAAAARAQDGVTLYDLPRLYHLDEYEACLQAPARGVYCVGSFQLLPHQNPRLLDTLHKSSLKNSFNRTLIHRGICLTASCPQTKGSLASRFEKCVNEKTVESHGLAVRMIKLDYCKSAEDTKSVDAVDLGFLGIVMLILFANAVGTLYDVFRDIDKKPNKALLSWSLCENWSRLTANHENGDQRLVALLPLQGIKCLTLVMVVIAHTMFAMHFTFTDNPVFLETKAMEYWAVFVQNGTVVVQTFILMSSFLMTYNLLLHLEKNPKLQMNLKMFPNLLIHRLIRITPVCMFAVGLAATWWVRVEDGPVWDMLVGSERQMCRQRWWMHLLYVNNLVQTESKKCLIQSWYIAADMQLYTLAVFLVLLLGRWSHTLKALVGLFLGSIVLNLFIAIKLNLVPFLKVTANPESMRIQMQGLPTFDYWYTSTWGSLPASLMGIAFAYFLYDQQKTDFKPQDHLWIRVLYRLSVPAMFLWVFGGVRVRSVHDPVLLALYAVINRPVFEMIVLIVLYGLIHRIDSLWWRFLSWRGFQVLGRMSLSFLMVHWYFTISQPALDPRPLTVSYLRIAGDMFTTIVFSLFSALPLYLMVEVPSHRFLESFKHK